MKGLTKSPVLFIRLFVGLLILGTIAVFGFGGNLVLASQDKPYSGEKIVFLVSPTPTVNAVIDLIPEFEEDTGAKVVVESVSYNSMIEKETLDLRTKQGKFDVFWVEATYLERYNNLGGLANLDTLAEKAGLDLNLDDFPDGLREAFSYKGNFNVLPFESNPMVVVYRKDLLKQEDLSSPDNWVEYKNAIKKLDKLEGINGTSIMGARHEALFYEYLNFLWGFGGQLFNEDMYPAINSNSAVNALEYLKSLVSYAPTGVQSYTWTESATGFQQGDVAMEAIFPDWTAALRDPEASKVVDKWSYHTIPGGNPTAIGGYGWAVNNYSDNKEAALAFANWATSAEVQRKIVDKGATLSRLSVMKDPELNEKYPYLKVLAKALKRARPPMKIEPYFELQQTLSLRLNQALTGSKSPEEALDLAQKEWVEIMKKSGYVD